MKAVKNSKKVEVKSSTLEDAVNTIKMATKGSKPVSFEICAYYYEEDED